MREELARYFASGHPSGPTWSTISVGRAEFRTTFSRISLFFSFRALKTIFSNFAGRRRLLCNFSVVFWRHLEKLATRPSKWPRQTTLRTPPSRSQTQFHSVLAADRPNYGRKMYFQEHTFFNITLATACARAVHAEKAFCKLRSRQSDVSTNFASKLCVFPEKEGSTVHSLTCARST